MEYTLENSLLKVTVSTLGAEVTSVIDKATGRELIWNGDKRFWGGHGPILFPACGGLWNGECTVGGKKYQIPKHGYVRKMEWEMVEQTQPEDEDSSTLAFEIKSTEETLKGYPFHFCLKIIFNLSEDTLYCDCEVINEEKDKAMPFQIGGHPSVMLPDYKEGSTGPIGYLVPLNHSDEEVDASCLSIVRVGEQGCWLPQRYPAPLTDDGRIPITQETFAHEALIFDHYQIGGFNVQNAQGEYLASITSDAPVFLVWQPQGLLSPFVCVEPWYGLCDEEGKSTELIERPYVRCVLPGEDFYDNLFSIEFAV